MITTRVEITPKGRDYIARGGLWVFANEFKTKMKDLKKGEWADFYFKNEFVGHGYVNPHSLIAGRICSLKPVTDRKQMFKELLLTSLKKRQSVCGKAPRNEKVIGTFRVVFAESDSLPGLVVDMYTHKNIKTVVAQSSTAGIDTALDDVIVAINEVLKPDQFVFKAESGTRHLEGIDNYTKVIKGDESNLSNGVAEEEGVLVSCDFIKGQKTGFFLDQRDNRIKLREFIQTYYPHAKVLDLCCYSGGWGLSALKAGAGHVTFVDQSADAIKLVKKGIKLNNFDESKTEVVVADVFDFLKQSTQSYEIVICDPPAFVKSKKNLPQAEQAYLKLNTAATKKLKPEGMLITCSCSYHLHIEKFTEIAATSFGYCEKTAQVMYFGGQSLDHPWIINRPESNYLKCLFLKT